MSHPLAALVVNKVVVSVAVADAAWADSQNYVVIDANNAPNALVNVGDKFNAEHQVFLPAGYTYDAVLDEFVAPPVADEIAAS